ncbi:hypothetical protein ACHAPT_006445 [Fusarium lateritium]
MASAGLSPPPTNFTSLPLEVRLQIIADVIAISPRLPLLATVSREWQLEVEKKTFESLFISRDRLSHLHGMVTRTRERHVKHICFSIDILRYTCRVCLFPNSAEDLSYNSSTVVTSLETLLFILGGWTEGGLTLEINVYSPSDSQHFFKGYYVGIPVEDDASNRSYVSFSDPRHG